MLFFLSFVSSQIVPTGFVEVRHHQVDHPVPEMSTYTFPIFDVGVIFSGVEQIQDAYEMFRALLPGSNVLLLLQIFDLK